MSERHRILAFGGVQSHALLALLGQGRYPGDAPEEIWFCDPKNERPQTYAFIERITKPYCTRLGLPFVTLERHVSPSRGPYGSDSSSIRKAGSKGVQRQARCRQAPSTAAMVRRRTCV